jgi:hypothetical protein
MDDDRIRAMEDGEERPLKVVFASPAEHFTDAAPIGNGSLGAMVWGGVASEKLQLNRKHSCCSRFALISHLRDLFSFLFAMDVSNGASSDASVTIVHRVLARKGCSPNGTWREFD